MKRLALVALVLAACRGPAASGDDAPEVDAGVGCLPDDPREPATEVFVGPTGLEARMAAFIDAADTSLDVQMYLFTVDSLADRIIAADARGVAVRVLLDPDHPGNADVRGQLMAAGVPVRDAPASFEFSHAKYLVADGATAIVTSANFNFGAIDSERNYGAVIRDVDDLADLAAIFASDWDGGAAPDLACTRLVVSPVNSRQRLLGLISGATSTLDLSVIYLAESSVRTSIIDAHQRGIAVRVILADPADFPENNDTITALENQGVPVRVITTVDLHAKLIIADRVAFVGSENLSSTSLSDNREVGVLVTEPGPVATIQAQLDADWNAATTR